MLSKTNCSQLLERYCYNSFLYKQFYNPYPADNFNPRIHIYELIQFLLFFNPKINFQ